MKKIFLFTILFSTICFAQNSKNGWQTANLKGKVKAAGQVEYVPNEKGELIQKGQNFSANFNRKGDITDMMMKQGDSIKKLIMSFDKNGFAVKLESFNEKGKLTSRNEHENDSKGNLLVDKVFIDDDFEALKTIFTYDAKGFLIEKETHQLGNYAMKSVFINDKKGNPIEEINYNSKDKVSYRIVSKYDKKGNRIEAIAYNGKGKVFEHYTYKYDKRNNLIEEKTYNPDGSIMHTKTIVYQYDKKKNWTKKTEHTDGKLTMVAEQFVEYF